MNAQYGHFGTGYGAPLGAYGKTSSQARCAAAKAAKQAGKSHYRLINVDVQIGKFCKEGALEEQAIKMQREAAGLGKQKRERGGVDPVLVFGGIVALGLLIAGGIMLKPKKAA